MTKSGKSGTKIDVKPTFSEGHQRHHDHYVRLYNKKGGNIEPEYLVEYKLAKDREKKGLVKPLLAEIPIPAESNMSLQQWSNIIIFVGIVTLSILGIYGLWKYYAYEVTLPTGGYVAAAAIIVAGLFFKYISRKRS